jgi:hypothetical protein
MPDYSSKVKTALSAGYAPSDIISFLAPSTRQNVNAESDVPLLAADIRRLQKQKGETVTPDQKAISEKGLLRRINDEILGAVEVPTALGMGALGAVTAIPFGIAEQAVTGKMTRAEQYLKDMQYKPQTAEGRRNLEAVGELVNSEALRPLQGAVNLPFNQLVPRGSVAPAVNYAKNVVGQEAKTLTQPITNALETRATSKLADKVAQSYERGPQIDAAKEANRLGISLDPAISNPTTSNKLRELAIDPATMHDALSEINKPKWANVAKTEMGIPETTPLTSNKPFEQARAKIAAPYENIRKIETLAPDETVVNKIEGLYDTGLIGGKTSENAIHGLIQEAVEQVNKGMNGSKVLDNISNLRKKASKVYNSNAATPEMIDVADTRMGIANALEDLIEVNVKNPDELTAFRKARADMARSYAYEGATDISTGYIDPQKLNRMLNKGIPLSGDAEAMARIAGNYPEVTSLTPIKRSALQRYSRSGALATAGAAIGSVVPGVGTLIGGATGAGVGVIGSKVASKRMRTAEYQAKHAVPKDYRQKANVLAPEEQNQNALAR